MRHPEDAPSRSDLSADAYEDGIEAAAEAIWYVEHPSWPRRWGWTEVPPEGQRLARLKARTAIEAFIPEVSDR